MTKITRPRAYVFDLHIFRRPVSRCFTNRNKGSILKNTCESRLTLFNINLSRSNCSGLLNIKKRLLELNIIPLSLSDMQFRTPGGPCGLIFEIIAGIDYAFYVLRNFVIFLLTYKKVKCFIFSFYRHFTGI